MFALKHISLESQQIRLGLQAGCRGERFEGDTREDQKKLLERRF